LPKGRRYDIVIVNIKQNSHYLLPNASSGNSSGHVLKSDYPYSNTGRSDAGSETDAKKRFVLLSEGLLIKHNKQAFKDRSARITFPEPFGLHRAF